jgi:hypothetical protein
MADESRRPITWTLLALRFLVELALFFSPVVIARRAVDGLGGLALGVVVAVAVAVVWGLVLSPRRRVGAALGVRVAIEAALFLAAAAGLALTGLTAYAVALLVVEVVVVAWLWALGLPPGTDVDAS